GAKLSMDAGSVRSFNGQNMPEQVAITNAASTANVSLVSFQVEDGAGNALAGVFVLDVLLSDAATGAGLTANAATGNVQSAGTNGADLGTLTAKKALRVQTDATGLYVLSITDTAKHTYYPCAVLGSRTTVGAQLTGASYG